MPTAKKKAAAERPELSRLEEEILGVLLEHGEATSAEIIAAQNRKRPLADTTVRTVLGNLREKGYAELVPTVERRFVFRATVSREALVKKSLGRLVSGLLGGSPRLAIAYLLGDADVNDDDLEAAKALIRARKGRQGGRA